MSARIWLAIIQEEYRKCDQGIAEGTGEYGEVRIYLSPESNVCRGTECSRSTIGKSSRHGFSHAQVGGVTEKAASRAALSIGTVFLLRSSRMEAHGVALCFISV